MTLLLISGIVSITSLLTAMIAAYFSFKSYKVNQQRMVLTSIQIERKVWLNRIKHFIKKNVEYIDWKCKKINKYSKKNYVIKNGIKTSTWDSLAKDIYYKISDMAVSGKFDGKETMKVMIENALMNELKSEYWETEC